VDRQRHLRGLAAGHPVGVGDPVHAEPGPPHRENGPAEHRDGRGRTQQREIRIAVPKPDHQQSERGADNTQPTRGNPTEPACDAGARPACGYAAAPKGAP
jgi:hypothetical protein